MTSIFCITSTNCDYRLVDVITGVWQRIFGPYTRNQKARCAPQEVSDRNSHTYICNRRHRWSQYRSKPDLPFHFLPKVHRPIPDLADSVVISISSHLVALNSVLQFGTIAWMIGSAAVLTPGISFTVHCRKT